MRDGPVRAEVLGEFARIEEAEQSAASAITMLALVNRAEAKLALAVPEPEKPMATPIASELVEPAPTPILPTPTGAKNISSPVEIETEITKRMPIPVPHEPRRAATLPDEDREFPL